MTQRECGIHLQFILAKMQLSWADEYVEDFIFFYLAAQIKIPMVKHADGKVFTGYSG